MATAKTLGAGRINRFLLCLTAIFVLTDCTLLSVRSFQNDFEGLNAAASRANSAGGTLRILFIHGMGHHPPGYSQPLMQGIASRLNLSSTGSSRSITIGKENHLYGEVNIANYSSSDGKKVRAYEGYDRCSQGEAICLRRHLRLQPCLGEPAIKSAIDRRRLG